MFPAPTTTASCVPAPCTATISSEIATTVVGSMPYSRPPRSASPESLRSARRNRVPDAASDACATSSVLVLTSRARDGDPRECRDGGARIGECLADRLRRIVDPSLLGEGATRHRREEALVQHAVHDLLTRGLGLRLDFVRVRVDGALGRDDVLGNVVARRPLGGGEGDVHRELACQILRPSGELDEHADLVGGGVGVRAEDVPGRRLVALRTDDHDVLAEPRDELDALVLELVGGAGSARVDGAQHPDGELLELVALRDRLRLAADADDRADSGVDDVTDEALRRLATGSLAGRGHPALAQERAG